jgi:hypothetical protein
VHFTPVAAFDQDAVEPGIPCWKDIVIEPVSDVCNLLGRNARRLDQALKEGCRRLACASAVHPSHDIDRKLGVQHGSVNDVGREIAGNTDQPTPCLHIGQAWSSVGVHIT